MPFYPDAPTEPVSALELIQRQQSILAINGENQRKRQMVAQLEYRCGQLNDEIQNLESRLASLKEDQAIAQSDLETARKSAEALHDESTAQIERDLENIESINVKVRANYDRERAEQEAQRYIQQYDELTGELEQTRQAKRDLLNNARLPLEGLSVEDGELTYLGKKWDGMSGSDQLKVATAIVRALNPMCGFVLLDKLEQFDLSTLKDFGKWAEKEGLQIIATRVSRGSECTIIIFDGMVESKPLPDIQVQNNWKAGVF